MEKANAARVAGKPDARQKGIIAAVVAAAMTKHNLVERRPGCQVWETKCPGGIRLRVSYHGGDQCAHRATITVFRRAKPVFSAMRSQQLFPKSGSGRAEAIDIDIPGDWETALFEKATVAHA